MVLRWLAHFRSSAAAFPLAALAALAMFAISEASYQQSTDALDALGEHYTARVHLNTIARGLSDAETGQRGYLLTGRDEYLQPYRDSLASIGESVGWLQRRYAGDAANTAAVAGLSEAVGDKLSYLSESLRLYDTGSENAWRELMATDIGKERMERVRSRVDELLAGEAGMVAEGRKGVYDTLLLNRIGVTAMAALSLLALFLYLRQSAALDRATLVERQRESSERERLEAEVVARTRQLRELARHLQTVREDERSLLARELHDELGALLTAAKLDAARLKSRLAKAHPEALERLQHLNDTLNGGIALKRRIIEDLRPSSLNNLGLVAALEILLREFAERSEITIESRLDAVDLAPTQQLTVYRLVQEALTNIAKYAKAKRVSVELREAADGSARVAVRDDGIGFDPGARSTSHGLVGMRFRVEAEGGTMRIESAPGQGTRIEALVPGSTPDRPEGLATPPLDLAA